MKKAFLSVGVLVAASAAFASTITYDDSVWNPMFKSGYLLGCGRLEINGTPNEAVFDYDYSAFTGDIVLNIRRLPSVLQPRQSRNRDPETAFHAGQGDEMTTAGEIWLSGWHVDCRNQPLGVGLFALAD